MSACDILAVQQGLVSVDTAIERAVSLAETVCERETVSLEDAIGRVLADDLLAPMPLPPFDNSAMDGYALRSADLAGNGPWRLRVAGRVAAGDDAGAAGVVGPGEAYRIFTGAAVPAGADAVIMQEKVTREGDEIVLTAPVRAGACIRRRGEDAPRGSLLLPAGTRIGAREIGAVASVGLPEIAVRRKLKVALLCTGSELRQPGEPLAAGQIYNSNRFIMLAALRQSWSEVIDLGAVPDNPEQLRARLLEAAEQADIIVTTGGVSVGEEDHMVAQLRAAGGEIEVLKVAMKPGKPLTIGRLGRAVFVGLPGNPVAAFTAWKIIGAEVAAKAAGIRRLDRQRAVVEMAETTRRQPGRQEFRPARIIDKGTEYPRVELLDKSFSAKISLICQSDGFAVIPPEAEQIAAGQKLEFVYL